MSGTVACISGRVDHGRGLANTILRRQWSSELEHLGGPDEPADRMPISGAGTVIAMRSPCGGVASASNVFSVYRPTTACPWPGPVNVRHSASISTVPAPRSSAMVSWPSQDRPPRRLHVSLQPKRSFTGRPAKRFERCPRRFVPLRSGSWTCSTQPVSSATCVPLRATLEALKGDLKVKHSIRVNEQWRILFRWESGDAFEVEIVDYH